MSPQATQVVPLQVAPGAVQTLFAQQFWPSPPQVPQVLLVQAWPLGQLVPAAVHTLATQQPLSAQALPRQQGWPAEPQARQSPTEQTVPVPLQVVPEQQGSPGPPQTMQVPFWQEAPALLQVRLGQHA